MRVIVTGGRDYGDKAAVFECLDLLLDRAPEGLTIVHGGATGADSIARRWVESREQSKPVNEDPHPALWYEECRASCPPNHRRPGAAGRSYCPFAGFYRNQEMADLGADLCVAFPGGRGTADMVRRAEAARIPVMKGAELAREAIK